MADGVEQGMAVSHPNREKAVVRATRATVIALLLASVAMVLIVSIGGAEGSEAAALVVQYLFVICYLMLTAMAVRWRRGALPVAAALAVLLAIFALVGGSSWFEREHSYFAASTLAPSLLGIITFALIPVQALLVTFAMRGFSQGWNVEVEQPASQVRRAALGHS